MMGRIRQWQLATTGLLWLLGSCATAPGVVEQEIAVGRLQGKGTYAWENVPRPSNTATATLPREMLENSIDQVMTERGYRQRPAQQAALHLDYDVRLEARTENLAPRDKFLEPRMQCDLHDCRITQQWTHFGPPLRSVPERRLQEAIVGITIRDARSGDLLWRARTAQELEGGKLDAHALQAQLEKLIRQLPRATAARQAADSDRRDRPESR